MSCVRVNKTSSFPGNMLAEKIREGNLSAKADPASGKPFPLFRNGTCSR